MLHWRDSSFILLFTLQFGKRTFTFCSNCGASVASAAVATFKFIEKYKQHAVEVEQLFKQTIL